MIPFNRRIYLLALLIGACVLTSQTFCQDTHDANGKRAHEPVSSIYVGSPKIYDDRSLEVMLTAAEQRLSTLQFVDQSTVAARVGALQGAASQQTAFSLQAQGAPTPQTTTKNTNTTSPSGTSTTAEADKTRASTTPSIPSLPASAGPAFPSTFSTSALDTLNEQMQLTYEVTNLRLLLEGSLSDRLINPLTCPPEKTDCALPNYVRWKQRATIGFPISIQAPKASQYNDAVAEVIVTVTTGEKCAGQEAPGIITILPRERTYNEAAITDKFKGFGLAAVTQVFAVGVAASKRSQTYYVVQDLDTVAFQTAPRDIGDSPPQCATTFGWQFRPTLGRKKVRDGLRQTFVQLSFAVEAPEWAPVLGTAVVRTRWRRYDPKTGALGETISSDIVSDPQDLPSYNLQPPIPIVRWTDAGNGQIYVQANGGYPQGTTISSGSNVWNSGTPGFAIDAKGIRVVAPVLSFMANEDAFIVSPGGDRSSLETWVPRDKSGTPTFEQLTITKAVATPWSDTESTVSICYQGGHVASDGRFDRVLALTGGATYGLEDKPTWSVDKDCPNSEHSLQFNAPTEALRSSPYVRLRQLFLGSRGSAISRIEFVNDFTVGKLSVLAKTEDCTLYAIQGSQFGRYVSVNEYKRTVEVKVANHAIRSGHTSKSCDFTGSATSTPAAKRTAALHRALSTAKDNAPAASCEWEQAYVEDSSLLPTMLIIAVPNCVVKNVQAIELAKRDPGTAAYDSRVVIVPLTPEKATEVAIDKVQAPVQAKQIKINGKQLQLIDLTSFRFAQFPNKALSATIASDGSSIQLTVPEELTATPGFYALTFKLLDKDKTEGATLVQITK